MKIFTSNAVYVQKIDLEFFKYSLHSLPQTISKQFFESNKVDCDDYGKYDFIKFENIEDIDFFKSVNWIIDYASVKDLSDEEYNKLGWDLARKREQATERLYSFERENNEYRIILLECKLLQYQISMLQDIADVRDGRLKIRIPEEQSKLHKMMRKIFVKENQ